MSDFYEAPKSPAERLIEHLVGERKEDLNQLFTGEPNINEPIEGLITGQDGIGKMLKSSKVWSNVKDMECIARIFRVERAMAEIIAQVSLEDKTIPVFITAFADLKDGRISQARIYYNTNLLGFQIRREPMIHSDPTICFPRDHIGAYHKALHAGDLEGVIANFEPDGYFKGPSGNYYQGEKELRKMFGYFFSGGDGIMLRYATLVDDGLILAIEYNYECWGTSVYPTEAGCAVYARGSSGKILRGRSCDQAFVPVDVPQPLPDNPDNWGPLAETTYFSKPDK